MVSARAMSSVLNRFITDILFNITEFIIHRIFFRARDWLRRVTRPNMPQLKLGNIREYAPGDTPQFSNFGTFVRAFSFCREKIVHLARTEHF